MKISQREARRLKARVRQLETERTEQRNKWIRDYPGGIPLGNITRERDWLSGRIEAARLLNHPVVVTEGEGKLYFFAVP